jgi:hypothetical protein
LTGEEAGGWDVGISKDDTGKGKEIINQSRESIGNAV